MYNCFDFPEDIKKRAEANGRARQERKRAREESEAERRTKQHREKTEKLMKLLEDAWDMDVVVKTTEFSEEVVSQFRPYYEVKAEDAPGDDYYHSLWRITTKQGK